MTKKIDTPAPPRRAVYAPSVGWATLTPVAAATWKTTTHNAANALRPSKDGKYARRGRGSAPSCGTSTGGGEVGAACGVAGADAVNTRAKSLNASTASGVLAPGGASGLTCSPSSGA